MSDQELNQTGCELGPVVFTTILASCSKCHNLGHSGAFTPGGAKPVCHAAGKSVAPAGDPNPYHWKHRVIDDPKSPPPVWCPLRGEGIDPNKELLDVKAQRDRLVDALERYRGQLDQYGQHTAADALAAVKGGSHE